MHDVTIDPHFATITGITQEELQTYFRAQLAALQAQAGIPYPLHIPEEAYYHSLFYMILKLLGAEIDAEVLTDQGRIDGVLECDERIYIIECKYGASGGTLDKLTQHALRQIHEKQYYEPFLTSGKQIVLLGIGFLDKTLGYEIEIFKTPR